MEPVREEQTSAKEDHRRKSDWRNPGTILMVLQIATVVGGAFWAVFLYVSFERKHQQHLLALNTLQKRLASLQVQESKLGVAKGEIELGAARQKKLLSTQDVSIVDFGKYDAWGNRLFFVSYDYTFTNTGSRPTEITYVTVEVYSASMKPAEGTRVFEVNAIGAPGALDWKPALGRAWYYAPKWRPDIEFPLSTGRVKPSIEGGTALLNSGAKSSGWLRMFIAGKPMDWISVLTRVGIDGGHHPDDNLYMNELTALYNAVPVGEARGLGTMGTLLRGKGTPSPVR